MCVGDNGDDKGDKGDGEGDKTGTTKLDPTCVVAAGEVCICVCW